MLWPRTPQNPRLCSGPGHPKIPGHTLAQGSNLSRPGAACRGLGWPGRWGRAFQTFLPSTEGPLLPSPLPNMSPPPGSHPCFPHNDLGDPPLDAQCPKGFPHQPLFTQGCHWWTPRLSPPAGLWESYQGVDLHHRRARHAHGLRCASKHTKCRWYDKKCITNKEACQDCIKTRIEFYWN